MPKHISNFFALFLQAFSTTSKTKLNSIEALARENLTCIILNFVATPYVCSTLFSPRPSFNRKWQKRQPNYDHMHGHRSINSLFYGYIPSAIVMHEQHLEKLRQPNYDHMVTVP